MNNYLAPNDGPTRIEKFLDEMKSLFRELALAQSKMKDDLVRIEAQNADQTALRAVQDEMRTYTDGSVKEGLARGESRLDDKMIHLRSAILSDVDERLKARLDEWTSDHIGPLFDQLLKDREERKEAERTAALKRWRERAAFATTIIVLLWAIFNPFGNSENAQETSRIGGAIESLNSAVN